MSEFVEDGWESMAGGMDSSRAPDLIPADAAALLVNVSCRGGKPKTRPRFQELALTGSAPDLAAFRTGRFLGSEVFREETTNQSWVIACCGGKFFKIDPLTSVLTAMTVEGGDFDATKRVYFCQAEKFLIAQNGEDFPIFFQNAEWPRSPGFDWRQSLYSISSAGPYVITASPNSYAAPTTSASTSVQRQFACASSTADADVLFTRLIIGETVEIDNVMPVEAEASYVVKSDPNGLRSFRVLPVAAAPTYASIRVTGTSLVRLDRGSGQTEFELISIEEREPLVTTVADPQVADPAPVVAPNYGEFFLEVATVVAQLKVGDIVQVFKSPEYEGTDGFTYRVNDDTWFEVMRITAGVGVYVKPYTNDASGEAPKVYQIPITAGVTSLNILPELPTGTIMAYGQGRVIVVSPEQKEFSVGDIVYGNIEGTVDSVLMDTERGYLAEGGSFRMPVAMGKITGLRFVPYRGTATGFGELVALGQRGAATFNIAIPRPDWQYSSIQRVLFTEIGNVSHQAIVAFNGDFFFRAFDGVRSYQQNQSERTSYALVPLGTEVNRIVDFDDLSIGQDLSAAFFDNRFLMGCSPSQISGATFARGLVVMDTTTVTAGAGRVAQGWDGLWTGLDFLDMEVGIFGGKSGAFVFSGRSGFENTIWKIDSASGGDTLRSGLVTPVACVMETRAFDFGDPTMLKKLQGLDMWLSGIVGAVECKVSWRPDKYPCWLDWHTFEVCADVSPSLVLETDAPSDPPVVQNYPQQRARVRMPTPSDSHCDPISQQSLRSGYLFQIRFEWTGQMQIERMRLKATLPPAVTQGGCP